jgi:hypothetical protein
MPTIKSLLPHSWAINDWPKDVYPGTPDRARYIVRTHKRALMDLGALSRVGRDLIVIGEKFDKWLKRHSADVADFEIAANLARLEGRKDQTGVAAP